MDADCQIDVQDLPSIEKHDPREPYDSFVELVSCSTEDGQVN